jgi:hypothetical protein
VFDSIIVASARNKNKGIGLTLAIEFIKLPITIPYYNNKVTNLTARTFFVMFFFEIKFLTHSQNPEPAFFVSLQAAQE